MKSFTRILKLCMFLSILPFLMFSQNDTLPKAKSQKLYFSTHIFTGFAASSSYKPEGAFSGNVQFQSKERFGFGLDITFISPRSLNYTLNPPASAIANYSEGVDEPYGSIGDNGVPKQDRFRSYSFYISKGIKPRDRVVIDFQAGFSLYQMKRNTYTYKYFPRTSGGLASLFGSGNNAPFVLVSRESGSSALDLGLYLRVNGVVRFRKRTVIALSPFVQINGQQSFYGIQLGIAFGREYKLNILK